jgi:hypothetical protein
MRWVEDVSLSERPRGLTTLNQKAGVITEERARGGPFRFEVRWHCVVSTRWTSILRKWRAFTHLESIRWTLLKNAPNRVIHLTLCPLGISFSSRYTLLQEMYPYSSHDYWSPSQLTLILMFRVRRIVRGGLKQHNTNRIFTLAVLKSIK